MTGGPFRIIEGGRADEPSPGLLIHGAGEIVTLAGGLRTGPSQGDVARLVRARGGRASRGADDPVVAVWEGRIAAVGSRTAVETALEAEGLNLGRFARLDAAGGAVTPGLVDPHTHLLFGGTREGELLLRQQGAGYLEILEAGGGILSTVAATRAATDEELAAANSFLSIASFGSTAIGFAGAGILASFDLRLAFVDAPLEARDALADLAHEARHLAAAEKDQHHDRDEE